MSFNFTPSENKATKTISSGTSVAIVLSTVNCLPRSGRREKTEEEGEDKLKEFAKKLEL